MIERLPITAELVRKLLDYDPKTGIFRWKTRTPDMFNSGKQSAEHSCATWNGKWAGEEAGTVGDRYVKIQIFNKLFLAHRLAVLIMTGKMPEADVDHKDLNKNHNSWKNIREATRSQNNMNANVKTSNKLGVKGVYYREDRKCYCADVRVGGKRLSKCGFRSIGEAAAFARDAGRHLHGKFYRE
jgi:hypothetical protein